MQVEDDGVTHQNICAVEGYNKKWFDCNYKRLTSLWIDNTVSMQKNDSVHEKWIITNVLI